jgi:hypothetical protein
MVKLMIQKKNKNLRKKKNPPSTGTMQVQSFSTSSGVIPEASSPGFDRQAGALMSFHQVTGL